jgi:hypothetical protein
MKGSLQPRPQVGIVRAEVATALLDLSHSVLSTRNAAYFSKSNIVSHVLDNDQYRPMAVWVADLFAERFNPHTKLPPDRYATARRRDASSPVARARTL